MHQSNWKVGLPLALTTAFLWALLPIAMKGLIADLDSTTVTWYRFFGAALFAGAFYGWRRDLELGKLLRGRLLPFTVLAVSGLLGNYIAYAWGLNYITPGALQVLIQLAPLLLLVFSVIWLGERFSARQWMGVMLVCIGLPLFFNLRLSELIQGNNAQYLIGVGLVAIAAVTWAIYGLFQKKIVAESRPQNLLVMIYLAGTLCFLPVANPSDALQLDTLGWGLLLFLTANTLIAYGAFAKAMAADDHHLAVELVVDPAGGVTQRGEGGGAERIELVGPGQVQTADGALERNLEPGELGRHRGPPGADDRLASMARARSSRP